MKSWLAWLRRLRDGYVTRVYGRAYAERWYAEVSALWPDLDA